MNQKTTAPKANEDLRKLNDIGSRLYYVRSRLELTISEVSEATGIPRSSYHGREDGVRTHYPEVYLTLAEFFNPLWRKKYGQSCPVYQGVEVTKITASFLLFGDYEQ